MQVKFLREWRGVKRDTVRSWPDGAANILISRGICEEVQQKKQSKKHGIKSGNRKRV